MRTAVSLIVLTLLFGFGSRLAAEEGLVGSWRF